MKTSFTIIAYNEEKNITNCINSILNQEDLENYEIVVVNDGSKDKTAEIVKDFSKKNRKIRLIDFKENKGRGFARFTAVESSKGDYTAFVDADIILPLNWSKVCLEQMKNYDAVGGIAVPDGDVNYIWRKCKVKPKIIEGTTEVTGNNGLYKKKILDKINYNSCLREGEDFDLNERLKEKGFKLKQLRDLIVEHKESKSYLASLKWLYQSGRGATKLLKKYRKMRLPDLAFFGFLLLILLGFIEIIFFRGLHFMILLFLYPFLTGFLHIKSRFRLEIDTFFNFVLAVLLDYFLIFSYYFGRIMGFGK
jgi:glycosyltransferase involved in cell wall biosynthesis